MKILRILLSEETVTSERELAKMLDVSHGSVNKAMKDFYELNLVSPLRIGNVNAWQINKDSLAYSSLDKKTFSPLEELKDLIKNYLVHLRAVKKVAVYGSITDGKELPNSDIDIFILVRKEEDKKIILPGISDLTNICIKKFGNKISPSIFTEKDTKKNRRLMESISKGIVVFERED
ncbi:MAG: nucleotidyltransferase domain-containing protein [Candidatus Aenigmarchaeota archaeon]|nr:nucleotidyltransferase domain-containing protein [Candidatus Aenigmarchaeota archaeon]MDI6722401.1 nucleotidyltransferase domain-containing protein [Candidatus Aenigmarchaeota archaeon]